MALKNKSYDSLTLVKLLMIVIFVAHTFGLSFQTLSDIEQRQNVEPNWLTTQELYEKDWFERYIYSIYFSVTTMTSVGYGDITPQNKYETSLIVIGMLISSGMFAYTFNLIGVVVEQIQKEKKEFKTEMSMVNRFLHKKKLSAELIIQVQKYLEYRFNEEQELTVEDQHDLFSKLSINLKDKIIHDSNMYLIEQCRQIFKNFSSEVLGKIAKQLNYQVYQKDEIIFEEGEENTNPCFFIVESGRVEMYAETYKGNIESTILGVKKSYEYFGEEEFFTAEDRKICTKATEKSILYYITRNDFLIVLKQYPKEYEKFKEITDNLTFNQKNSQIQKYCESCKNFGHLYFNCPHVNYCPDNEFIILKGNYSIPQKRSKRNRYERIRYNSRCDIQHVLASMELFLEEYENMEDFREILFQVQKEVFSDEEFLNLDSKNVNNLKHIKEQRMHNSSNYMSNIDPNEAYSPNKYFLQNIPKNHENLENSNTKMMNQQQKNQESNQFFNAPLTDDDDDDDYDNSDENSFEYQGIKQDTVDMNLNNQKIFEKSKVFTMVNNNNMNTRRMSSSMVSNSSQGIPKKRSSLFKANYQDSKILRNKNIQSQQIQSQGIQNQEEKKSVKFQQGNFHSQQTIDFNNNINRNKNSHPGISREKTSSLQDQQQDLLSQQVNKLIKTSKRQSFGVKKGNMLQEYLIELNKQMQNQKQQQVQQMQMQPSNRQKQSLQGQEMFLDTVQNQNFTTQKKEQKQQLLHDLKKGVDKMNYEQILKQIEDDPDSILNDSVAQFTNYFPQANLNIHLLAQKLMFQFTKKTPGFGIYTFFWRKISVDGGFKRMRNKQQMGQSRWEPSTQIKEDSVIEKGPNDFKSCDKVIDRREQHMESPSIAKQVRRPNKQNFTIISQSKQENSQDFSFQEESSVYMENSKKYHKSMNSSFSKNKSVNVANTGSQRQISPNPYSGKSNLYLNVMKNNSCVTNTNNNDNNTFQNNITNRSELGINESKRELIPRHEENLGEVQIK